MKWEMKRSCLNTKVKVCARGIHEGMKSYWSRWFYKPKTKITQKMRQFEIQKETEFEKS